MSAKDVAEFEVQLNKLCEHWRQRMTHAELVGVLDTMKMVYHIRTIESGEEIAAPVNFREPVKVNSGSPLPAKVTGGSEGCLRPI
jgi:hypothetical protein